jgi:Flp pilus assembly protein TadG
MFANKLKESLRRLTRPAWARRFVRRQDGAAAVEFGMVMFPFFTMMFVMIETAMVFFASQTLETAVADSSRLIMTGQANAQGLNADTFKNAVCARIYGLFNCCSGMYVDAKTYTDFSSVDNTVKYDTSGNPITTWQPGNPSDIVVVRLLYQWPITVPLVQSFLADPSAKTRMLVATAAFRNEPFTAATNPPAQPANAASLCK